jgi:hypothetical protein
MGPHLLTWLQERRSVTASAAVLGFGIILALPALMVNNEHASDDGV